MSKPVVIVGGGIAGLVAAVELTSNNIPVTLLEQKPRPGGRAYSFLDSETHETVDNGQHVLIAGYKSTLRFLEKIGTLDRLMIQPGPSLMLHHPARGFCEFKLPHLPSPFHLVAGILTTNLLSWRDKMRLMRAGLSLQLEHDPQLGEMTIEEWLNTQKQSSEGKRSFWEPLAIAITNEHIANASAGIFLAALRQAFLSGWKNSAIAIPRVGLSELLVDEAVRFIENAGGQIRCNTDAESLNLENEGVTGVRLRGGETVEAQAVILAVPHYRLESLIPARLKPEFSSMNNIPSVPIVSVHMWFDRDFMPQNFVGLVDRRVQWIFNRRKINHETSEDGHITCVVSAARDLVDLPNDKIAEIALSDLRSVYASAPISARRVVVHKEKRASFASSPHSEKLRPPQTTKYHNLFLAGDWTNTGLPATIEGAAISGEKCAELIIRNFGARPRVHS